MRPSLGLRFAICLAAAWLAITFHPPVAIDSNTELAAQSAPARPQELRPEAFDETPGALRQMALQLPPEVLEHRELPRKALPNRLGSSGPSGPDPLLQRPTSGGGATVNVGFEGVNNINGVLPPDTNGDVGPNHYVQTVNLAFAVWDKLGNLLYGPANINTLWAGFGGACETSNDGDPIVLYDALANRWLMAQFALPRFPSRPF